MNSPRLHPLTLRFASPDREAAFRADYFAGSVWLVRLAVLLGCGQYALFGFLDPLMVPHALWSVLSVRVTVCVVLLLACAFTFSRYFNARTMQAVVSVVPLIGGLGVGAMAYFGQQADGYYDHYAGLMLILFYVHVLLRLRFVWATGVSWLIVGAYHLVTLTVAPIPPEFLLNNSFFLTSANFTGMVASYALEYYARRVFWQKEQLEAQHDRLLAEDARKTQELEEIRELQLGLLPQTLPDHPAIALAAFSRPATEVGGDYYDVEVGEDGTLTLAIGDATGHGARAGAMVTAAKVLFASIAAEADVAEVLRRATPIVRRVGRRRVFMALALGRLRADRLELAGAGMPPALIRRAGGAIEAVPLKGMPLGSLVEFGYHKSIVHLYPGDTVVLMSDGFAELFNPDGDMLGYEAAAQLLAEAPADASPEAILNRFCAAADAWAADRTPHDDVTFLVLQRKPEPVPDVPGDGKSPSVPITTYAS